MPQSDLDTSPLQGTWQMVRAELSGQPAPDLVVQKTQLELGAGTYVVRFAGVEAGRGTYELGSSLERQTLVLRGTHGANAGRTIPCIYQLVGDRIRICYGLDGVMPDAFATVNCAQRYLGFYRRDAAD